eukprot:COSAG01_NODE_7261_length_3278_cov_1.618119_2_plen_98_part_00
MHPARRRVEALRRQMATLHRQLSLAPRSATVPAAVTRAVMHAPRLAQLAAEHAGARDSLASALGQESAALRRYRQSPVRHPHGRPAPTDKAPSPPPN